MGKTKIEWTGENGYTWNPIVGCSKISSGCAHCYAETMAKRLAAMGQEKYQRVIGPEWLGQEHWAVEGEKYGWNGKCFLSERELEYPFHWKQPRRIFVSSMGDLFHENVPDEWIDRVMAVIALNPRHTFIILTKRAERMAEYFSQLKYWHIAPKLYAKGIIISKDESEKNVILKNLHIGVTAENQETADLRIPILLQIPAALRFVSIEPMLGSVEILNYHSFRPGDKKYGWENQCSVKSNDGMRQCGGYKEDHLVGLDWVILGMETGHGARTFPGAAEAIVNVKDQCQEAGAPFFYKGPKHIAIASWAANPQYHFGVYGDGKEKEYTINGVEYRQFPEGI